MTNQTTMRVLVYGTLKQGYGNHRLLEGSYFVGTAKTIGRFAMLDGGFPVVMRGSSGHVTGEIYDVDAKTLQRLDMLEANGSMYEREVVDLELDSGKFTEAWMYIGMPRAWGNGSGRPAVEPRDFVLEWHSQFDINAEEDEVA